MSYNPFVSAFQALTCRQARAFYAEHVLFFSLLVLIAADVSISFGLRVTRSHLIPASRLAIARVVFYWFKFVHFIQSRRKPRLLLRPCPPPLLNPGVVTVQVQRVPLAQLPSSGQVFITPPVITIPAKATRVPSKPRPIIKSKVKV